MYTIDVVLEGIAPFLANGWSTQALIDLDNGKTGGKPTPAQRHQEACEHLRWFDHNGQPAVPDIPWAPPRREPVGEVNAVRLSGVRPPRGALKLAIVRACALGNLKEGRYSLGTYLDATLFVDEEAAFEETEVYMDARWGRRPAKTGSACIIRRPALPPGWRLPVTITVTDNGRHPDRVREAVAAAGVYVGIGSGRPDQGRFEIRYWQENGYAPPEQQEAEAPPIG
jgi:hypothetical protein